MVAGYSNNPEHTCAATAATAGMSDRARGHRQKRSLSRPRRGRSKSSPRKHDSWEPDSEFAEGFAEGYRKGSFKDGAEKGFEQGYLARRTQKAVDEAKFDTEEDYDDETDSDSEDHERKRQGIMNVIEELTQPDGELTKETLPEAQRTQGIDSLT